MTFLRIADGLRAANAAHRVVFLRDAAAEFASIVDCLQVIGAQLAHLSHAVAPRVKHIIERAAGQRLLLYCAQTEPVPTRGRLLLARVRAKTLRADPAAGRGHVVLVDGPVSQRAQPVPVHQGACGSAEGISSVRRSRVGHRKTAPDSPVLWKVLPGGLETPAFPFGDVARMG